MEWQVIMLLIFSGLFFLMLTGMPIALSFLLFVVVGVFLLWGGQAGLEQLGLSIYDSLNSFELMPVPLFILMGELLFFSGIAVKMIDVLDEWLGRLPGRLSLMAVGAGTILATLTGASIGSIAMLGSMLVPEMEKRGYKKSMSLGAIMGSGGLAIMIPPSSLAVLLGAIGEISVGQLLIAIIVPGLVMAVVYAAYIILRCWLQPVLAPPYDTTTTRLQKKVIDTARYILPVGIVVFLVTGVIFLGVATPSEAAATGVAGSLILIALYGKLNWQTVKKSTLSTIEVTAMVFLIIAGAKAFSQILAFSGASVGLSRAAIGLPIAPIFIVVAMQVVLLILGMFLTPTAIMMICLPLFMPVINGFGLNPVWFGATFLLNMEVATLTPPVGMGLYVMKGVAPPDTTMGDVIRAAMPYVYMDIAIILAMIFLPPLTLWLPGMMRR